MIIKKCFQRFLKLVTSNLDGFQGNSDNERWLMHHVLLATNGRACHGFPDPIQSSCMNADCAKECPSHGTGSINQCQTCLPERHRILLC